MKKEIKPLVCETCGKKLMLKDIPANGRKGIFCIKCFYNYYKQFAPMTDFL